MEVQCAFQKLHIDETTEAPRAPRKLALNRVDGQTLPKGRRLEFESPPPSEIDTDDEMASNADTTSGDRRLTDDFTYEFDEHGEPCGIWFLGEFIKEKTKHEMAIDALTSCLDDWTTETAEV